MKATLQFNHPDRVPVWKAGLGDIFPLVMMPTNKWQPGHDEAKKGLFPHVGDDLAVRSRLWRWKKPEWAEADPRFKGTSWLTVERDEIDEWGCVWHRDGKNSSMGHPGKASLTDWSKLDAYLEHYTPDVSQKSRYSLFLKLSKIFGRKRYRMAMFSGLGPFQLAADLRGFSTYLIDHRKHPNEVKRLLAHITETFITSMDCWIKYGGKPHGFVLYDDLGEQNGSFFSPKTFKEFYEPVYRTLYEAAHDRKCDFHHHCCGKIDAILPLLFDWGLDAIELDAPRMTGYSDLKQFRGKKMIWGCINIQSIYPNGTPEECEREVWHMVRNLGTPEGGFGAYFYPQTYHIQVPKANVKAFNRGLEKYGVYANIPPLWWDAPLEDRWENDKVPLLPSPK